MRGSRVREAEIGERWPDIPEWVDTVDLDGDVRRDLRSLSKENSAFVGAHLIAAGTLADEDPEPAWAHARAARSKGGRIAVVRETAGLVAYRAGEWAEAISELRAARRLGGGAGHLAVLADCERALGHPEKAIEISRSAEVAMLEPDEASELTIVVAGARADLGQLDAAIASLEATGFADAPVQPYSARVYYAYADLLEQAGRRPEALDWFMKAADNDSEEDTDAGDRITALAEAGVEPVATAQVDSPLDPASPAGEVPLPAAGQAAPGPTTGAPVTATEPDEAADPAGLEGIAHPVDQQATGDLAELHGSGDADALEVFEDRDASDGAEDPEGLDETHHQAVDGGSADPAGIDDAEHPVGLDESPDPRVNEEAGIRDGADGTGLGGADPTPAGENDGTGLVDTGATDPGDTEPTDPGDTEPTQPGETDGSEPSETDSTEPSDTARDIEPGDTEPGETGDAEDSQVRGTGLEASTAHEPPGPALVGTDPGEATDRPSTDRPNTDRPNTDSNDPTTPDDPDRQANDITEHRTSSTHSSDSISFTDESSATHEPADPTGPRPDRTKPEDAADNPVAPAAAVAPMFSDLPDGRG